MNVRVVLWVVVLVGFVASLYSAARRWQTETRNRSIEITLDYNEVRAIAISERKPISEVLREFKKSGVTSISLQEETIGILEEARLLRVERALPSSGKGNTLPFQLPTSLSSDATALYVTGDVRNRVHTALSRKLGIQVTDPLETQKAAVASAAVSIPLVVDAPYVVLRSLGVGLNPDTMKEIRDAGLAVIGRVANYNGVRPDGIEWELNQLKQEGIQTVIFAGDEMLGYRGYLIDDSTKPDQISTARAIQNAQLWVGVVEFGKQKGEVEISKGADDRVVRVHTVTGAEMLLANVPTNVQRFTLAARERNIRLLYIRLFTDEQSPLDFNTDYIEKVVKGMERGDLVPGIAHGYGELTTPLWLRFLICLGMASAWLLLVDAITLFLAGGAGPLIALIAGGGVLLLLGVSLLGNTGAKLAALASSCIYPALALLHKDLTKPAPGRSPIGYALLQFLLSCGITAIGIAAIVGLLSDRLFLIKADAFIGIKVSQLIPVLLVGLVYGLNLRATPQRSTIQALRETGQKAVEAFQKPILIWQVVVALGALVVLTLLVLRSGNDPGVGVSPIELKIRAILDQLLYARPRFKEFLFGHPAMVLALIFAAQANRTWAIPLLIIGAIGQASLLNTFCHLHTPLLVSLWRAGLGILIGAILGLVVYGILGWITGRLKGAQTMAAGAAS